MACHAIRIIGMALAFMAADAEIVSLHAADQPRADERSDVHSYANAHQIRVRHVALDLAVDFAAKQLRGSATLTIERQPGCPSGAPLVLDTRALTIERVSTGAADVSSLM